MMYLCSLFLILLVSTQAIANRSAAALNSYRTKLISIATQPSMLRWIRGEALVEVQDEKLREILKEIGVSSAEEFEQTLTGYASILDKLFLRETEMTRQDVLTYIVAGNHSFGHSFTHMLMNRISLTDVDRRATIAGKMLASLEISHLPWRWWGRLDYLGLERLILLGNGSLRDFVYMRYAVGEGLKLQSLFDALLRENGLSKKKFDTFFTSNKDKHIDMGQRKNYVDLRKRKDIIDRMLDAVRTSPKEKRTELLAKIGLRNSSYDYYVYGAQDLPASSLIDIQIAIGADTELNSIFDEFLLEHGTSRQAFEQAITDVTAVFSTVWQLHYPEREITRELALQMLSTDHVFYNGNKYFGELITDDKHVFSPTKAEKISSIFREVLAETASTQKGVDHHLSELGIGNFFDTFVTRKPSHDELSYVKYALVEGQRLPDLFDALLAEYDFSAEELVEFQKQYDFNHRKIIRRKDIIDRMLDAVRTSSKEKRAELLAKIGLGEHRYLRYLNSPYWMGIMTLSKIQLAIGDDVKLNALFDELLGDNHVSRRAFEKGILDTAAVYDILFDRNSPKRVMPPRQLVLQNLHHGWLGKDPYLQVKNEDIVPNILERLPHPPVIIEIVSVLREMLENVRTSDEQTIAQLMQEIGLSDNSLWYLVYGSSYDEYHKKIMLSAPLADLQLAIGEDVELNTQLDKLTALLNVSRQELALENMVAE